MLLTCLGSTHVDFGKTPRGVNHLSKKRWTEHRKQNNCEATAVNSNTDLSDSQCQPSALVPAETWTWELAPHWPKRGDDASPGDLGLAEGSPDTQLETHMARTTDSRRSTLSTGPSPERPRGSGAQKQNKNTLKVLIIRNLGWEPPGETVPKQITN
jgi:hypothetical protein